MAKKRASTAQPTPIDSHKHREAERANIPTEELRDFVAADEQAPKTMRYPRNPDLDPQLVWRGKDAQDSADLEVPVVPIYIQEKIHPQALIEDVRRSAKGSAPAIQDLFADFNGIDFEQLIEFYQHSQHWSNRMILGDSLQVMTSLAEKERLKGQVQMIYLDPPYGIKFGSNWQVSTRKRNVEDGKVADLTRQPEQVKAFRDTWELGIHSYLAYLRDRLVVARELLTESGSIFVQIGDENVHLVRCLLDEVFGADNFIGLIWFRKKTMPLGATYLERMGDYIIWFSKSIRAAKFNRLFKSIDILGDFHWNWRQTNDGIRIKHSKDELLLNPSGDPFRLVSMWPPSFSQKDAYDFPFRGRNWQPPPGQCYPSSIDKLRRLDAADRLEIEGKYLRYVMKLSDDDTTKLNLTWTDTVGARDQNYVIETNPLVIGRCLLMTTDPGDLVLDPTCGSGTTAYVAEQWGRRWITIDTSRVALALARTRLMAARFPYYLLADSHDGRKKAAELTGIPPSDDSAPPSDNLRHGFVYKTVPHVTLKSIANNDEIDAIHARWQDTLEPLRAQLNAALQQTWEEWEIPREASAAWPAPAKTRHADWWQARRARQQEIDASIARHAGQETLYDQPYEDKNRLRVTGPFTVESLSPHRMLPTHLEDEDEPDAAATTDRTPATEPDTDTAAAADFATMILDNLRKAGVQNTVKDERLTFARLEPFPGQWLHAEGDYQDKDGQAHRVAVSIGPEHGTVGAHHVKEAAKEAVQGVGFDLLLVCGFAFDPSVPEEAKRYGQLTVLPTKMNPDLAMGEDLLKKTGSGNLFMIFGEPDIAPLDPATGALQPRQDGRYQIEILGVDIYDPTTGQIRSHGTADIACWFIDTDYNGESFFVRHAYFTGADKPYEKLKKALKAEVDEAAWDALYRTKSRAFDKPASGKVAVKVINHYGDEVLKVFNV